MLRRRVLINIVVSNIAWHHSLVILATREKAEGRLQVQGAALII